MKKTLAAAITSALVIGVASTTFAAANPFSDVPTDHWSFDAVAKLAQEGVIEGYGDNTFRGDAHITRYEMAQMVAKAMAKEGVSGADKATIDKLAAEYADELNNLGVRVANLEKRSDNVKFEGLLRLDSSSKEIDYDNFGKYKDHKTTGLLRLDMTAFVNDDWSAKARLDATTDLDNGDSGIGDEKVTAKRIYAEGPLFGATAKLGKFGTFDSEGLTNGGLIVDADISGAEFAWNSGAWTTTLTAGRVDGDVYAFTDAWGSNDTSDYMALQFRYAPNERWNLAAGYHNLSNNQFGFEWDQLGRVSEDNNGIWTLGFDYKFNNKLTLGALYAGSSVSTDQNPLGAYDSDEENSYAVQLTYGAAKSDVPQSYGLWLAYRQIGAFASMAPTYDGVGYGEKGIEFGVDYMAAKNILTKLVYFNGEEITTGADVEKIFGRVEFQF